MRRLGFPFLPSTRTDRILSFPLFLLHLRSPLTPKVVCNSPSSHIMSTMPAGGEGREGGRERVQVRPMMTFGWFDKKCFEDSQLRKQERHRSAELGGPTERSVTPNPAVYFSTKVTTFQSRPNPRLRLQTCGENSYRIKIRMDFLVLSASYRPKSEAAALGIVLPIGILLHKI